MNRTLSPALGVIAALSGVTFATSAAALEAGSIAGEPINVDVTDATSVVYNVDNRNTKPASVETRTDDEWGTWYNRLNAQANSGSWQAGLRLDSAWFYLSPDPTEIGLDLLERRRGSLEPPFSPEEARFFLQKTQEAGDDLSSRYINWIYPAKYYVGYTSRHFEAQFGDVYAQFGRGLVLSVRKLDELSSDTTIRGGRATARWNQDGFRLRLTAVGGTMNPLRLDEASGRYLSVDSSVTDGIATVTEAGMPRTVDSDFSRSTEPSYAPDQLVGIELQGGTKHAQVGIHTSLLDRQSPLSNDIVRTADTIRTGSISLNIPNLDQHGTAYAEVALQDLSHEQNPDTDLTGFAAYGSLTFIEHPVALTFEGKHYRSFYPLSANIDLGQAQEFVAVQYSAPPTTEAFWVDTEFEGFNTCVTGGRLKGDIELGEDEDVFLWVGRYNTWAESVTNERCEVSDSNLNRVWDLASGFEITSQKKKSRANTTFGVRLDQTDRLIPTDFGGQTHLFYQESYVRYDILRWLSGSLSLQLQGWHRRRTQTFGGPRDPYHEGQHLTGIQLEDFTAAVGVEYDTDPRTPTTYFNGQLQYDVSSASNVALFVGQRRGGLRCVSGVCRIFPPFEGVRLDATLRL